MQYIINIQNYARERLLPSTKLKGIPGNTTRNNNSDGFSHFISWGASFYQFQQHSLHTYEEKEFISKTTSRVIFKVIFKTVSETVSETVFKIVFRAIQRTASKPVLRTIFKAISRTTVRAIFRPTFQPRDTQYSHRRFKHYH
ncbi:hypothetical protein TWF281_009668 [Arthrobotrys megalospora]